MTIGNKQKLTFLHTTCFHWKLIWGKHNFICVWANLIAGKVFWWEDAGKAVNLMFAEMFGIGKPLFPKTLYAAAGVEGQRPMQLTSDPPGQPPAGAGGGVGAPGAPGHDVDWHWHDHFVPSYGSVWLGSHVSLHPDQCSSTPGKESPGTQQCGRAVDIAQWATECLFAASPAVKSRLCVQSPPAACFARRRVVFIAVLSFVSDVQVG